MSGLDVEGLRKRGGQINHPVNHFPPRGSGDRQSKVTKGEVLAGLGKKRLMIMPEVCDNTSLPVIDKLSW